MLSISIVCNEFQAANYFLDLSGHLNSYNIISFSESCDELISTTKTTSPDVIFLCISDDETIVLNNIHAIKNVFPTSEIILVLKAVQLNNLHHYLAAGAIGIIVYPLTPGKIDDAIHILEAGGSPIEPKLLHTFFDYDVPVISNNTLYGLTTREQEVVMAISAGLSYKMVADKLHLSIETVRHHIKNIYRKMKINSKGELLNKVFTEEIKR